MSLFVYMLQYVYFCLSKYCLNQLIKLIHLQTWYRVSLDETLWKELFLLHNNLEVCHLAAGKQCWRSEVRRIHDNAPVLLTETLTDHTDEVLHVSFSHDGKMFSTTSKDATLKVIYKIILHQDWNCEQVCLLSSKKRGKHKDLGRQYFVLNKF